MKFKQIFKQIFCKHRWLWIGMRTIRASDGYPVETFYQLKCEKCGKQCETNNGQYISENNIKKAFNICGD